MSRKKIPYGISNFEALITQNYYYVDKTRHLEILENLSEKYISFFRPRRFGKSLFASMLSHYYDKAGAARFEELFGNLYIGKNPTPLKNSYYILKFNFSGINVDSSQRTYNDFKASITSSILDFVNHYQLKAGFWDSENTPNGILSGFFSAVKPQLSGKIFVIIDEYDHFTSELLGYNKSLFDEVVSQSGYFRKFFEVLKIGTESIIDRIFFTGVNPFTLDSLTSGFNISTNLTLAPELQDMLGFSESEIKKMFFDFGVSEEDFSNLLPVLKNNFDGYKFLEDSEGSLYNSDMVLYFARDYLTKGRYPKNLIDENIASSYAKIKRFTELGDRDENLAFIRDLIENKDCSMALTTKFEVSHRFTADDFKSLFFYMGLVTITGYELNVYKIKIPNYVIREVYYSFFESILNEAGQYSIDSTHIATSVISIAKHGDIGPLIKITEASLNKLSNRDFIRFDEKYVKLIMLTYLFLSKIYYIKTEYEVEDGYIDIALLPRINVKAPNHAIIELKYISKEKFSDTLLQEKIAEARNQIQKYNTSEELKNTSNLLKFVVVFSGEECVHWEQVSS